jgi:hypothetical protein
VDEHAQETTGILGSAPRGGKSPSPEVTIAPVEATRLCGRPLRPWATSHLAEQLAQVLSHILVL